MRKIGILLLNLGTPDAPTVKAVRRYLREFLLDPRVIRLPTLLRYALVYGIILPFRSRRSAHAYKKIWMQADSPLRFYTQALTQAVGDYLGEGYQVEYGMRYGNPSIENAIEALKACKEIKILPLFPQYASASTGSAVAKALEVFASQEVIPSIKVIQAFYDNAHFIAVNAAKIAGYLVDPKAFLLLSYHGLPQQQINQNNCQRVCESKKPCPLIQEDNYFCYRAQCYQTSELIANALSLSQERYMTAFQSRLGRLPWIEPYTDQSLKILRDKGIKHLVVACPSFVVDCLETLEEMGMQLRAQWLALGGEHFELIPCVNLDAHWVEGIVKLVQSS